MLPQPFVTTAQAQNESLRVALDLTEEWEKVQGDDAGAGTMITGATIARTEFVQEHPEAVENFLKHYQESVEYVNANTAEAAKLMISSRKRWRRRRCLSAILCILQGMR